MLDVMAGCENVLGGVWYIHLQSVFLSSSMC